MGFFNKHGHDCNAHDLDLDSYVPRDVADEDRPVRKWVSVDQMISYDPFGDDFRFHDEGDDLDLHDIERVELYHLDTTGIINDTWSMEVEDAFGDFYDDDFHGMVGYQEDIRDWHYSDCRHIDLVALRLEAKDEEVELELQTGVFKLPSFSSNRRPMIRMNAYASEAKYRRRKENDRARRYH